MNSPEMLNLNELLFHNRTFFKLPIDIIVCK